MPKLSSYSNFDYPEGEEEIMPWEFWTEEQRSLVIRESYRDTALTSTEVKPYLNTSRLHFWTQWLVPLGIAAAVAGPLRHTLLADSFRRHYMTGYRHSAYLVGGFTLLWVNLSPFYLAKERAQEETLKVLWKKMGANMKLYNDMVSRSTTSTSIDKDTYNLWQNRNCSETGLSLPDEDQAPPFLAPSNKTKRWKKQFL